MNRSFYRVWGKFYGYPDCCINEMLKFYAKNPDGAYAQWVLDTQGGRKLNGTGFIPCTKCNKKKVKQIEYEINSKRISNSKFPLTSKFENELQSILESDKISRVEKKLISLAYKDR